MVSSFVQFRAVTLPQARARRPVRGDLCLQGWAGRQETSLRHGFDGLFAATDQAQQLDRTIFLCGRPDYPFPRSADNACILLA